MKRNTSSVPHPSSLQRWLCRNWIAILVLALSAACFAGLYLYATAPESEYIAVATGKVVSEQTGLSQDGSVMLQQLRVELTSGEFAGSLVEVDCSVSASGDSPYNDGKPFAVDDPIYLNLQVKDGQIHNAGVTTEDALTENSLSYETAKILRVLQDNAYADPTVEGEYRGDQQLEVELTSGPFKGTVVTTSIYLGPLARSHVSEGETLTVSVSSSNGEIRSVDVMDYNRGWLVLLIAAIFILVTALVGGKTGIKSILGLIFTIVCLIFILVPLLLKGFDTVWTVFGLCAYIAVVCFTLLGGISRKTVCAMLGTIFGVAAAAGFAGIAGALLRVNGYRLIGDGVEALLNLRQSGTPIQLSGLLTGGIMIAALGAVMDVAMSISSAISELSEVNPDLTRRDLWKSAMNIGRDMVGTMTNTLILAFVGGTLVTIIYYSAINTSLPQLLGSYWFCIELVKGLASSIGVILSVPLAAAVGAVLFGKHHKTAK